MSIDNAIARLAVKELESAKTWYEALLRRTAESTPMSELMIVDPDENHIAFAEALGKSMAR